MREGAPRPPADKMLGSAPLRSNEARAHTHERAGAWPEVSGFQRQGPGSRFRRVGLSPMDRHDQRAGAVDFL